MSESPKQSSTPPFKTLGARLKEARIKRAESMAEVSGAVEIDEADLIKIERGQKRPPEDILMMLISHFALPESEAGKLWHLAGYDHPQSTISDTTKLDTNGDGQTTQTVLVMPMNVQIAYTDVAHIMMNDFGVMLNFLQSAGVGGQMLAVARVGMSREHAESLLKLLQKTLEQSKEPKTPKALPPGDEKPKSSKN